MISVVKENRLLIETNERQMRMYIAQNIAMGKTVKTL